MVGRAIYIAAVLAALPAAAEPMPFCFGQERYTCVVDGDTFWLEGEKIRLADIDAPESGGRCVAERVTAANAAGRLAELLAPGNFEIERTGKDHYERTLAIFTVKGKPVAEIMISEGLARPWRGKKERWCDEPASKTQ